MTVSVSYGVTVLRCYGVTVLRCYGVTVSGLSVTIFTYQCTYCATGTAAAHLNISNETYPVASG